MVDFRELVKAGVHFGHQKSRRFPKMASYIWGEKNRVSIINVAQTAKHLQKAADFLKEVAAKNQTILWIGTKKPAQQVVFDMATKLDSPYVNHRWVGGTLSNASQVKKSVTKMLHFEDIIARSDKYPNFTKKELNVIQKMVTRLQKSVGGIRKLNWPIGAIVMVDVEKEASALQEAVVMGIPVVALVDTNCDPSLVDYVIPANDDSERSIRFLLEYLAAAVQQGKEAAVKNRKDQEEQKKTARMPAAKKVEDALAATVEAAPLVGAFEPVDIVDEEIDDIEEVATPEKDLMKKAKPTAPRRPENK
jgi:small subunit ribosomal protein S2